MTEQAKVWMETSKNPHLCWDWYFLPFRFATDTSEVSIFPALLYLLLYSHADTNCVLHYRHRTYRPNAWLTSPFCCYEKLFHFCFVLANTIGGQEQNTGGQDTNSCCCCLHGPVLILLRSPYIWQNSTAIRPYSSYLTIELLLWSPWPNDLF